MPSPRRHAAPRARVALVWALLSFAGFQLGLLVYIERCRPELREPEFGRKRALLRARLAEAPGRPLLLVLGTSRLSVGLRPEVLTPDLCGSGEAPLVFNFGLCGGEPLMELVCLRQLLLEGVRPRGVVIEVLPALLHSEPAATDWFWPVHLSRMGWGNLPLVRSYADRPAELYLDWCQTRLVPWSAHRFGILSRWAPSWLPWQSLRSDWLRLDPYGWWHQPAPETAARRRAVAEVRKGYAHLINHLRMNRLLDRALREMVDLCRREGIEVRLLLMPEAKEFRGWYRPAARRQFDAYFARLSRECAVPVIDARDWIDDALFADGHHLLDCGAVAFTERFGREVVRPLARPSAQASAR
jgi:hypothetical protein